MVRTARQLLLNDMANFKNCSSRRKENSNSKTEQHDPNERQSHPKSRDAQKTAQDALHQELAKNFGTPVHWQAQTSSAEDQSLLTSAATGVTNPLIHQSSNPS